MCGELLLNVITKAGFARCCRLLHLQRGEITFLCQVRTVLTWHTVYHRVPDSSQDHVSLKVRETDKLHLRCELFSYPSVMRGLSLLACGFASILLEYGLLLFEAYLFFIYLCFYFMDVKKSWQLKRWNAFKKIPVYLEDLTGFEILRRDENSRVWMGACAQVQCQFSTSGIYEA